MNSKWIEYNILCGDVLLKKRIGYNDANLVLAQNEAYNGYSIVEDDESYEPVGSVAKKLLWTNEETFGQYAAQTISLDLSEYDGIEVLFIADFYDAALKSTGFIPHSSDGRYFIMDTIEGATGAKVYVSRRGGNFSASNISFHAATRCAIDGSAATEYNFACIPYQIYGVKGMT